jgi:RNA polymerase sigma factor (sigma-70 family)
MENELKGKELDEAILELIPMLKLRASKFLKSSEDSNDLFQETFLKIWSNKDKFVYNESLRAWCYKIMYNTLVDNFKEKKKTSFLTDESDDIPFKQDRFLTDFNDAETNITTEDIYETIEKVLSPIDVIIVTKKLSGFKQSEIAEELGLEINNVKQHYFQAIRKVRKELSSKFNLDENYGNNSSLIDLHKSYRRIKIEKEGLHRKKFK